MCPSQDCRARINASGFAVGRKHRKHTLKYLSQRPTPSTCGGNIVASVDKPCDSLEHRKPYQESTCISITGCASDIKIALFTVLKIILTYICYRVHNIFLAFRYEDTRKNPATAPITIPPVVAQNAHCKKTNLLSTMGHACYTMDSADTWHRTRKKVRSARLYRICFEI